MIYQKLPNWVLGFHGTDEDTVFDILNNPRKHLRLSKNDYDWLGDGIYFWENDPVRALEFAKLRMKWKQENKKAAVIGAIIDLDLCMNLTDQSSLAELATAHTVMAKDFEDFGVPLPENSPTGERWAHYLDCAVFTKVHELREWIQLPAYKTVRAAFKEGAQAYSGTEDFKLKNHIQIAVRDPASCIKGYFLPRQGSTKS